jgi:hypothetical protein
MVRRKNPYQASKEQIKLIEECMKYLLEGKIDFLETEPLLDAPIESFDW